MPHLVPESVRGSGQRDCAVAIWAEMSCRRGRRNSLRDWRGQPSDYTNEKTAWKGVRLFSLNVRRSQGRVEGELLGDYERCETNVGSDERQIIRGFSFEGCFAAAAASDKRC